MIRARSELLTFAQVISVDAKNYKLKVMDSSGQALNVDVLVGVQGAADALRINQHELPIQGTWGLVAMPYGDDRNAVWICSIPVGPINAVSCNPSNPDPYLRYLSHYSGYFETLDQDGNKAIYFPDGTSIVVGSSTSVPPTYRNSIDGTTKTVVQTNPLDRITTAPSPFNINVAHPSGTSLLVDPSGNTTVTIGSGAEYQVVSGSNIIKIDSSGNITITGVTVTENTPSGGEVNLDNAGNVNVTGTLINLESPVVLGSASGGSATCAGTLKITTSGAGSTINIGGSSTFLQLVTSAFVSVFNNHTHTGVTTGGGITGVPSTPMTSSELTVTLQGS